MLQLRIKKDTIATNFFMINNGKVVQSLAYSGYEKTMVEAMCGK